MPRRSSILPQRADLADATRGDQGVGDVRQRTDRKESGLLNLANHEHLNGADRTHRHVHLHAGDLFGTALDKLLRLLESQARHFHRSDLRNQYTAVALDLQMRGAVDAAPHQQIESVARTQYVVRTNRHVTERCES